MVLALIQARMGSIRLPGKVLSDISGQPLLWHIINRVSAGSLVDRTVVVTSGELSDNPVADFCSDQGILCFRGSENDVLDRYYQAARHFNADVVVRITGDCPLIDPEVMDNIIGVYLDGDYDYVTNTLRYTYPDGLDVEVFSFHALERAWKESCLPSEREHVTPYIRNSGLFQLFNVENERDLSQMNLRWTVDEPSDLDFVRSVYAYFARKNMTAFGMHAVLDLLETHPDLIHNNGGQVRNEGYYRSLRTESPVTARKQSQQQSEKLKKHAAKLIPSCTQTFSKGPSQYVQGVAPVFISRAGGSHVWDLDGNEYIDYPMALGPVILGHNYPEVSEAVIQQISDGTIFSLPHPLEVEVADLLCSTIPCDEMVRFGKNGSDVTSGAVRVARAYTGRDTIACCGYHGWQDWYIGTTTRNKGVPKEIQNLTVPFEFNNIKSLEKVFEEHSGDVAAVIMEPVGIIEPQDKFLEQVREITLKHKVLLVFDEVVTGFRLARGGAQEYFGVIPDMACFGKALANGYPLSAVVGKREIMELFNEVFFSFTFGGETLSLAAAKATIMEIERKNVIPHLWEQGRKLKDGYNVLAREFEINHLTECVGLPPRTVITFKDESGSEWLEFKSLFQQECLKRGILFSGGQNICYVHTDKDIDYTLRVYRTAMEIAAEAVKGGCVMDRLEGNSVQPVFRKP